MKSSPSRRYNVLYTPVQCTLYISTKPIPNITLRDPLLGYEDEGDRWRQLYEDDTFKQDIEDLFQQVKPLYKQLHAYVRRNLKKQYGEKYFPKGGHIPAHILG